MNYPSNGLFEEDKFPQFSEVNLASNARLNGFYPSSLDELKPSSEETNLNLNKYSFRKIPDNSNMNSTIIGRISLRIEELANSFKPSLQALIEGNKQMSIITPIVTSMVWEEFPKVRLDQILPENIFFLLKSLSISLG